MTDDIYGVKNKCDRKHMPPCIDCVADIRSDERQKMLKKIALLPNPYPKDVFKAKKYDHFRMAYDVAKRDAVKAINEG